MPNDFWEVGIGGFQGVVSAHLFDLDDTLIDTRASFVAALDAIAARYLPGHTGAELVGVWRADAAGHYRAYTRGELTYHQQRAARADELSRHFGGAPVSAADYPQWAQVFDTAWQEAWAPFPDAVACLTQLKQAGMPVGVVTNADTQLQRDKLRRTGLERFVDVLVCVDTLGVGKPDPRIFHHACQLLGSEPAETMYVGDELDIDAMAACDAGLVGVWLDRPSLGHPDSQRALAREAGIPRRETLDEFALPVAVG